MKRLVCSLVVCIFVTGLSYGEMTVTPSINSASSVMPEEAVARNSATK